MYKVLAGSQIPTNGVVVSAIDQVDESMITGEANLIMKSANSQVVAGNRNQQGVLLVHLTRLLGENTIRQSAEMTYEAVASQQRCCETAVASQLGSCLSSASDHSDVCHIDSTFQKSSPSRLAPTIVTALMYAVAVPIVSCPGTIGLAMPMVLAIASGSSASTGSSSSPADF